jgi:hypothetical protein
MIDLSTYFANLATVALLVVLITGWVKTNLLKWDGWKAQLLSWGISISLAFLGKWKGIGIFADTDTVWTIIQGIGAGLVANGIYTVELVQSILAFIKAKPVKTEA